MFQFFWTKMILPTYFAASGAGEVPDGLRELGLVQHLARQDWKRDLRPGVARRRREQPQEPDQGDQGDRLI